MNEIKRRLSDLLWPILRIITLVLMCFFVLNACVMLTKPIPNRFQLGRVTVGGQSLVALWPYGHHHELILGVPGAEWNRPPRFAGTIRFQDGDQRPTALTVHSTNSISCNWLQPQDIQGFILTWPNTNAWAQSLLAGREYSIHCEFTGELPGNCTLWVSCLQSGMDRWKTRRNRTTGGAVRR